MSVWVNVDDAILLVFSTCDLQGPQLHEWHSAPPGLLPSHRDLSLCPKWRTIIMHVCQNSTLVMTSALTICLLFWHDRVISGLLMKNHTIYQRWEINTYCSHSDQLLNWDPADWEMLLGPDQTISSSIPRFLDTKTDCWCVLLLTHVGNITRKEPQISSAVLTCLQAAVSKLLYTPKKPCLSIYSRRKTWDKMFWVQTAPPKNARQKFKRLHLQLASKTSKQMSPLMAKTAFGLIKASFTVFVGVQSYWRC